MQKDFKIPRDKVMYSLEILKKCSDECQEKKFLILHMQQWADLAIFIPSPISKTTEYNQKNLPRGVTVQITGLISVAGIRQLRR